MRPDEVFSLERKTKSQRIKEISQCARDSEGVILCPRGRCFGYREHNISDASIYTLVNGGGRVRPKNRE